MGKYDSKSNRKMMKEKGKTLPAIIYSYIIYITTTQPTLFLVYFKPALRLWYPDEYFAFCSISIQLRKQSDNDEKCAGKDHRY
jgi:hypothetical protein